MSRTGFISLFLILLITSGVVYKHSQEKLSYDKKESSEGLIAESLLRSATELRLSHSDEEIVFSRTNPGEDWVITEPFEVPLEKAAFDKVYGSIIELRSLNSVEISKADKDVKAYGFDTGEFSFSLSDSNGRKESWLLGKKTNFSEKRYIIKDSEKTIHLVDDSLALNLMKRLSDFRDLSPIKFDPEKVFKINRRIGMEVDTIEKLGESWFFQGVVETIPVDSALIESKLSKWRKLEAEEVIAGGKLDLSKYGLESGLITITLHQKGEKPLIMLFGESVEMDPEGTASKRYFFRLNREEGIFRTRLPSYRDFLQPLELLRDRTPFDELDRSLSAKIVVSKNGQNSDQSLEFSKAGSGWLLSSAKNQEELVKKETVSLLLSRFHDVRILTWLEENRFNQSKFKKDEARLSLEVFDGQERSKGKIYFGRPVETQQVQNIGNLGPPVYGAVQSDNGAIIPAVISSGEFESLQSLLEALE